MKSHSMEPIFTMITSLIYTVLCITNLSAQPARLPFQSNPKSTTSLQGKNFALSGAGGGWKIRQETDAIRGFAKELIAADDEASRDRVLDSRPAMLQPLLIQELNRGARELTNQGEYAKAEQIHLFARKLSDRIGDKAGLAGTYHGIGIIHYFQNRYKEALESFQQRLQIGESIKENSIIAPALNDIATILIFRGEYESALERLQKSYELNEAMGDRAAMARAVNNIGNVYDYQGKPDLALENFRRSLEIAESIQDRAASASALNGIGNIHIIQSQYQEALSAYQRVHDIRQSLGDKLGMAKALSNIGVAYDYLSRYDEARKSYERSREIYVGLQNKGGIAATSLNLGNLHLYQGDLGEAMKAYLNALDIYGNLGDKPNYIKGLINVGVVHNRQGQYEQAVEVLERSLRFSREIGDKDGIASSLNNLGLLYVRAGQQQKAHDAFQESRKLAEGLGDKHAIARAMANLTSLLTLQEQYSEAHTMARQTRELYASIGDRIGESVALKTHGDVYFAEKEYGRAIEAYNQSASVARELGYQEYVYSARAEAGRAYRALGEMKQAHSAFEEAIAIAEQMRRHAAGNEQDRQGAFERKASVYADMAELLSAEQKAGEALQFAEQAKARVLVDILQTGRTKASRSMSPQELAHEQGLLKELASINLLLLRERQNQSPKQERLTELESRHAKARVALDEFRTRLFATHPELKVQRGETPQLSISELHALLPDAATAFLEYVYVEEKVLLFVGTRGADLSRRDKTDVHVFSIPAKGLADRITAFQTSLAKTSPGFAQDARSLYDLLLKPAQRLLQGKKSIIIVPDGALWNLPFQALLAGPQRYLLEDVNIQYAPSLTSLREMNRKRPAAKSTAAPTLLAIGNPAMRFSPAIKPMSATRGSMLEPLPMAEKEVQALTGIYGPEQSNVLIGAQAREGRFKAEAGKYSVLHLATHGLLNDRSPMYSQLLFSQSGDDESQDGLLEAREVLDLDLKADLAVLSACETAQGRIGAGEGVIGLSWAFFVAGVPATVVSQWKVQDASTQQLMVEFHRQLKTRPAQGKAEALRQAMLKVMKQPRTAHPFFWAPFVLIGADR